MSWHWVDIFIVIVIGLSVFTGLARGFIKEIIALCVWILAIWLAVIYSNELGGRLQPYLHDKTVRLVVSFVSILLLTVIVGGLVNALLSFILTRSGLSGTDRLLGMMFGFLRGVFIVTLMMLVVQMTSLPNQDYIKNSQFYARFEPLVAELAKFTPEFIQQVKALDKTDVVSNKLSEESNLVLDTNI